MSETIYRGHGGKRLQVRASGCTSGEVTDLTRTPELTGGMVLSSSSEGAVVAVPSEEQESGNFSHVFFKEKAIGLINLEPLNSSVRYRRLMLESGYSLHNLLPPNSGFFFC